MEWSHWPELRSIHTKTEWAYENGNQHWSMVGRHTEFVRQCSLGAIGVAIRAVDFERSIDLSERVCVDTVSLAAHPRGPVVDQSEENTALSM